MHTKRHGTILILIGLTFPMTNISLAQEEPRDSVYLKTGTIVSGTILEMVPGDSIRIKTLEGSIVVLKYSEIDRVSKDYEPTFAPDKSTYGREGDSLHAEAPSFYRKDICGYLGLGINTGGDYSSDYKTSLIKMGYSDVRTGIFLTLQGGFEFRVYDRFFLGPNVKVDYSTLKVTYVGMPGVEGTKMNLIYAYGATAKFFPITFNSTSLYLTASYEFFGTSYDDDRFAFDPDGQVLYFGLGFELSFGSRYLDIELGLSTIPVVVGNKKDQLLPYYGGYGYTQAVPLLQSRNFGGIEIGITGMWGIGMY